MPGRTPLLPHQIRTEQVGEWLADSVNQAITFHQTSREASASIIAHGVVVTRSQIGSYGQGFYTATEPDSFYGEATVTVAIRLRRPLLGRADDVGAVVDEIVTDLFGYGAPLTVHTARAVRAELRQRGYDGIIARDAGGSGVDYVIALDGASVKVVLP